MAIWTSITNGLNWQSTTFVNELITGVNQRVQGLWSPPVITPVTNGTNIQSSGFWASLQTNLEACIDETLPVSHYIDQTVTIAGTDILVGLSLANVRSRAGIHADGFSRATAWPTNWLNVNDAAFSQGFVQEGDILGPWIFLQLQQFMSEMFWTAGIVSADVANYPNGRTKTINQSDADCATSLANSSVNWAATGWTPAGVSAAYNVQRFCDGGNAINCSRYGSKLKTSRTDGIFGAPACNFDWSVYFVADGGGRTFLDMDGLGLLDGKYYNDQNGGPSATWDVTTPNFAAGGASAWPAGLAPAYACPQAFDSKGAYLSEPRWIYKWIFSNA